MTRYDKIARMKPEQKNHWLDVQPLSYWGERVFAEIAVAEEINTHEAGRYEALLNQAVDILYEAWTQEHALPDSVCRKAEEVLLPLSETAKSMTMHCVAHAHIDMDWMWGFHETVDVALNTFRTMLDLMDEYPDFTFSQSQAAVYRIAQYYDPELFERIRARVKEGRWEYAGSSFVELDKNLPSLESMARHILYTKRYLRDEFGIPMEQVKLDFHPDSFGHSPSVPSVLAAGRIRYFYHCRGLDDVQLYRWQGDSGAEVLALNEPLWYNDLILPMYLHIVPQFCYRYGVHDMMKVYGVGDHGGGPTRKDLEMILDMQKWPVAPTVRFSTYETFFAAVEPYRETLPVVKGQLGPTFTGCYTSQSRMKAINRMGEDRLYEAEMISAFARKKAHAADFTRQYRDAWEKVLFNQFHDILPGSNTPESAYHALGAFEEAMGAVMAGSASSLRAFAKEIDTSMFSTPDEPLASRSEGGGVGLNTDEKYRFRISGTERGRGRTRLVHLFNPTCFDRKDVAEFTLWDWPGNPEHMKAFDAKGTPIACRVVRQVPNDWNHLRTDVLAEVEIPAFGYTTIKVEEGERDSFCFSAMPPDPRVTRYCDNVLENDLVKITFDNANFAIVSCVDKVTGKELLSAPAKFVLYHELHTAGEGLLSGGNAWVEGIRTRETDLHQAAVPTLLTQETGTALCKSLSYRLTLREFSLTVTARLFDGNPTLELTAQADRFPAGDETGVPQLVFCAPMAYQAQALRCDMQVGVQDRQIQGTHDDFTRNFLFGVPEEGDRGLALVSDCKYGCRCQENALTLTLLRASDGPDRYPEIGQRFCRIGLTPAQVSALKELGERFAHWSFPYTTNTAHAGTLPLSAQLVSVRGDVTVSGVKMAEEGNGLVLRLANLYNDRPADAEVSLGFPAEKAVETDLAEQEKRELALENGKLSLTLEPGQIVTVMVL